MQQQLAHAGSLRSDNEDEDAPKPYIEKSDITKKRSIIYDELSGSVREALYIQLQHLRRQCNRNASAAASLLRPPSIMSMLLPLLC
jgi:hypothetical protein